MTALIAGSAADFARGASDPRTSSRAHLRRGLALSAALHLLVLALVLRLAGGETTIDRTYLLPADVLLLRPITELAPPLMPDAGPPIERRAAEEGAFEPKITPPSIPLEPFASPGPARPYGEDVSGAPPDPRGFVASAGPAKDPDAEVYRVVDELPVPVFAPTPAYPAWAREAGVTGRVLLEALVGRDGRVRQVVIVKDANGLGGDAKETLLRWVFRPARVNGAAVATWVAIPIVFRL